MLKSEKKRFTHTTVVTTFYALQDAAPALTLIVRRVEDNETLSVAFSQAERAELTAWLVLQEALQAIAGAGYQDVTEEANQQNKASNRYVFAHPGKDGVHYCDTDEEVREFAEEVSGYSNR